MNHTWKNSLLEWERDKETEGGRENYLNRILQLTKERPLKTQTRANKQTKK